MDDCFTLKELYENNRFTTPFFVRPWKLGMYIFMVTRVQNDSYYGYKYTIDKKIRIGDYSKIGSPKSKVWLPF